MPNDWFWLAKIQTNRDRDRDTDRRMTEAGWVVVRVWEHEPVDAAGARVAEAIAARLLGN